MIEGLLVGLIVAAAAGYIIHKYVSKKSGGCGCGCKCGESTENAAGKCCGGGSSIASSPGECRK